MTHKKVALITGGSMGLGKAAAERFASLDYEVVTCARHGDVTFCCDVSSRRAVKAMVDAVVAEHGRIDVLVCNAAIYGPVAPLEETGWSEWVHAIAINLMGTVLCCRAVLPIMKQHGYGKIITLSGGGVRPNPNTTAYNTSKGGVLRFTEALARDLEGTGIDVNAVAPGVLDTRMRLRATKPDDPEAAMQRAVDLIAFLTSSRSDGISGRLFSSVWDDWEHLGDLGQHDYRMRRVVPT